MSSPPPPKKLKTPPIPSNGNENNNNNQVPYLPNQKETELLQIEFERQLENVRNKKAFICDMDGVVYHGEKLLPGMKEFHAWLVKENKKFIFLTNNSAPSPKELQLKLKRLGLDVPEEHFFTSALATASFLQSQKPSGCTAYAIGEAGLYNALYNAGITLNNVNPDYVVIGESTSHNFEKLSKAVDLVLSGAKLIGTNPDNNGPVESGKVVPATGAFISVVEKASLKKAYFVGKPNPLMMRHALEKLGAARRDTCIIGDRMDTDIIAGVEAQITSVLVLSGVTKREDLAKFPYQPHLVLQGVGDIPPK